ncbi:MAG: methyltransferase domain-containing protein [Sphingomonadales bacterium]|nr:methyltransferase domain-containing protein [Sphingomonadales bacterium]
MASPGDIIVFDRRSVARHRARAAKGFATHAFLHEEIATRLLERLGDVNRVFPRALALGLDLPARPGAELTISGPPARAPQLLFDEEALPFAPQSLDLIVSNLALHWVNDLPGALLQIRQTLRPDGLFLGALLGGETLKELRQAFLEAEARVEGGASPRVSPFADVRTLGGLMQRAGFALPLVDADTITVTYADAFALMRELRGMGETNAHVGRRKSFTRRQTLIAMAEIYRDRFGGADGRIPATFQVIYLTGWAPHDSQPKPLKPGSAQVSLVEALGRKNKSRS